MVQPPVSKLAHFAAPPINKENAKSVIYCLSLTTALLDNRRVPLGSGRAKSGDSAVVSWDPYDARNTAKRLPTRKHLTGRPHWRLDPDAI
jgi:hypothetical protein